MDELIRELELIYPKLKKEILPKDIIVDNVRMRSDIGLLIDSIIHEYKFGRIDVAKFSFRYLFRYLFKLQKNNKFDSNNFIKTMLKRGFL